MSLPKGSELAREEMKERHSMRKNFLQDMLDDQLKERAELLEKKAEL